MELSLCRPFPFGDTWMKSSVGVQQGDPLGPLLFSLALLELLDDIGTLEGLKLQLWYLDIGSCSAIASLLDSLLSKGPSFGFNTRQFEKCEIFWPSGNQEFPAFDNDVQRTVQVTNGVDFLGTPVYGSNSRSINCVQMS